MAVGYLYVGSGETRSVDELREEIVSCAVFDGATIDCWTVERGDGLCRPGENVELLFMGLDRGEVLYVNDVTSLGGSLKDIVSVLSEAYRRGITIRDTEGRYGPAKVRDKATYLSTLKLAGELSTRIASARTRTALGRRRGEGARLGRPLGSRTKMNALVDSSEQIEKDCADGATVSEICSKYGVSPSTFRRYREEYARPEIRVVDADMIGEDRKKTINE